MQRASAVVVPASVIAELRTLVGAENVLSHGHELLVYECDAYTLEIMRFIRATSEKHGLRIPNVFHAGDGNIHPLILYDERDPAQVTRAVQAGEEILEKCVALGGSVTGEHGIGVEKADMMARQFTPDDLEAMKMLRRVFDPAQRCNPHKMFPGSKRCADFVGRKQIAA